MENTLILALETARAKFLCHDDTDSQDRTAMWLKEDYKCQVGI